MIAYSGTRLNDKHARTLVIALTKNTWTASTKLSSHGDIERVWLNAFCSWCSVMGQLENVGVAISNCFQVHCAKAEFSGRKAVLFVAVVPISMIAEVAVSFIHADCCNLSAVKVT